MSLRPQVPTNHANPIATSSGPIRLAARILAADRSPDDPNAELTPEEKLAKLEEQNERAGEEKRQDQDDLDPTTEPDTPIQW